MGRSRIRKITSTSKVNQREAQGDVFYMSLEEAKAAIQDKYAFLADRYEDRYPKHKGIT